MSISYPEIEIVDRARQSIRYLEHGWPTNLCRWHAHEEYELHFIVATRGKAFVGDYIGDFGPGALFLTGPNLPHNWITDDVWKEALQTRWYNSVRKASMNLSLHFQSLVKFAKCWCQHNQALSF